MMFGKNFVQCTAISAGICAASGRTASAKNPHCGQSCCPPPSQKASGKDFKVTHINEDQKFLANEWANGMRECERIADWQEGMHEIFAANNSTISYTTHTNTTAIPPAEYDQEAMNLWYSAPDGRTFRSNAEGFRYAASPLGKKQCAGFSSVCEGADNCNIEDIMCTPGCADNAFSRMKNPDLDDIINAMRAQGFDYDSEFESTEEERNAILDDLDNEDCAMGYVSIDGMCKETHAINWNVTDVPEMCGIHDYVLKKTMWTTNSTNPFWMTTPANYAKYEEELANILDHLDEPDVVCPFGYVNKNDMCVKTHKIDFRIPVFEKTTMADYKKENTIWEDLRTCKNPFWAVSQNENVHYQNFEEVDDLDQPMCFRGYVSSDDMCKKTNNPFSDMEKEYEKNGQCGMFCQAQSFAKSFFDAPLSVDADENDDELQMSLIKSRGLVMSPKIKIEFSKKIFILIAETISID